MLQSNLAGVSKGQIQNPIIPPPIFSSSGDRIPITTARIGVRYSMLKIENLIEENSQFMAREITLRTKPSRNWMIGKCDAVVVVAGVQRTAGGGGFARRSLVLSVFCN